MILVHKGLCGHFESHPRIQAREFECEAVFNREPDILGRDLRPKCKGYRMQRKRTGTRGPKLGGSMIDKRLPGLGIGSRDRENRVSSETFKREKWLALFIFILHGE